MLVRSLFSFVTILVFLFTSITAHAKVPEWVENLAQNQALVDVEPSKQSEITCLALAIYFEARGESEKGQRAVAQVVINRTRSGRFPTTVCGVLFQKSQFSFIRGNAPVIPRTEVMWHRSLALAKEMINTPETSKWLFFCNCGKRGSRLGNHVFY